MPSQGLEARKGFSKTMSAQSKISRGLAISVIVLLGSLLLVGCGGTGHTTTTSAPKSPGVAKEVNPNAVVGARPQPAGDQPTTQNAAITKRAKAACEQAVRSAPDLAAVAKDEIAALCFRINYVPEDNENTVRSVCQEVANASSLASEAARRRTISACYAVGIK
jgi:hypothetical protein